MRIGKSIMACLHLIDRLQIPWLPHLLIRLEDMPWYVFAFYIFYRTVLYPNEFLKFKFDNCP